MKGINSGIIGVVVLVAMFLIGIFLFIGYPFSIVSNNCGIVGQFSHDIFDPVGINNDPNLKAAEIYPGLGCITNTDYEIEPSIHRVLVMYNDRNSVNRLVTDYVQQPETGFKIDIVKGTFRVPISIQHEIGFTLPTRTTPDGRECYQIFGDNEEMPIQDVIDSSPLGCSYVWTFICSGNAMECANYFRANGAPNEPYESDGIIFEPPEDLFCGDGICSPEIGESSSNCLSDCPEGPTEPPIEPPITCGNNQIDGGENCVTCPQDMPAGVCQEPTEPPVEPPRINLWAIVLFIVIIVGIISFIILLIKR